jgi:hypothetical protein
MLIHFFQEYDDAHLVIIQLYCQQFIKLLGPMGGSPCLEIIEKEHWCRLYAR